MTKLRKLVTRVTNLEIRMQKYRGETRDDGYALTLLYAPIDDRKWQWSLNKLAIWELSKSFFLGCEVAFVTCVSYSKLTSDGFIFSSLTRLFQEFLQKQGHWVRMMLYKYFKAFVYSKAWLLWWYQLNNLRSIKQIIWKRWEWRNRMNLFMNLRREEKNKVAQPGPERGPTRKGSRKK